MAPSDLGRLAKQKATWMRVGACFCADAAAPSATRAGYRTRRAAIRVQAAGFCANRMDAVIRSVLYVPFLFFSFSYTLPLGLPSESIIQDKEETR
ncbi:hypothetical protein GCM10009076_11260 [Erythrobacter ramosus]